MKFLPLNRSTAPHFVERINKLRPDSQRLWGTMQPHQVAGHLKRSLEISLGEVEVTDKSNFLTRSALVKWLSFGPLPIPHNIKAPAYFFPSSYAEFATERDGLLATIPRYLDALEKTPDRLGPSELFGPMPLSYWSQIHGKHLDHHLRQFGC